MTQRTTHPCPCCGRAIDWFAVTCVPCRAAMDRAHEALFVEMRRKADV